MFPDQKKRNLQKIEKVLIDMQNNRDLKALKNQLILKEYVSTFVTRS